MSEDDVGYFSIENRLKAYEKTRKDLIEFIIKKSEEKKGQNSLYTKLDKLLKDLKDKKIREARAKFDISDVMIALKAFMEDRRSILFRLELSRLIVGEININKAIPSILQYFTNLLKKDDTNNNDEELLKLIYLIYKIIIYYKVYSVDKNESVLNLNHLIDQDILNDLKNSECNEGKCKIPKDEISDTKKTQFNNAIKDLQSNDIIIKDKFNNNILPILQNSKFTDAKTHDISITNFKYDTRAFEINTSTCVHNYKACINIIRISSILSELAVKPQYNPHFLMVYFFEMNAGNELYTITEQYDNNFKKKISLPSDIKTQVQSVLAATSIHVETTANTPRPTTAKRPQTSTPEQTLSFILTTTLDIFKNLIDQAMISIFSFHEYTGYAHADTRNLSNFRVKHCKGLNGNCVKYEYHYDKNINTFYLTFPGTIDNYIVMLWGYHNAKPKAPVEDLKQDYIDFLKAMQDLLSDSLTSVSKQIYDILPKPADAVETILFDEELYNWEEQSYDKLSQKVKKGGTKSKEHQRLIDARDQAAQQTRETANKLTKKRQDEEKQAKAKRKRQEEEVERERLRALEAERKRLEEEAERKRQAEEARAKKYEEARKKEKEEEAKNQKEAEKIKLQIDEIKKILDIKNKLAYITKLLEHFSTIHNPQDKVSILTALDTFKQQQTGKVLNEDEQKPFYLHKPEISFSYYVGISLKNSKSIYITKHALHGKVTKHPDYIDIFILKNPIKYEKDSENDYIKIYNNKNVKDQFVYLIKHKQKDEYACLLINTNLYESTDLTDSEIDGFYTDYIENLYTLFINIMSQHLIP